MPSNTGQEDNKGKKDKQTETNQNNNNTKENKQTESNQESNNSKQNQSNEKSNNSEQTESAKQTTPLLNDSVTISIEPYNNKKLIEYICEGETLIILPKTLKLIWCYN